MRSAMRLLLRKGAEASQLWASKPERLECLERGDALCRLVAEKLATYSNWHGGLNNFQSPDPFRVRVNALHNSGTLKYSFCRNNI